MSDFVHNTWPRPNRLPTNPFRRRFRRNIQAAVFSLLGAFFAGCGTDGLYIAGVIGGDEATDIIADSVISGTTLCSARKGTLTNSSSPDFLGNQILFRELAEPVIQLNFAINPKSGYRLSDVNNCADYVRNGVALSTNCNYEAFICYLNPVNRWTGGN